MPRGHLRATALKGLLSPFGPTITEKRLPEFSNPVERDPSAVDTVPEEDAPVLPATIAAEVDYLVTGNTRHFIADPEAGRKSGLVIVTPAQLVELLSDWA